MKRIIVVSCILAALAAPRLRADIVAVTIDTTPLAGTVGFMAFDLLGGTPIQNNVVTISSFVTTGTLGTSSTSGDVTGSLTSQPVVLTASTFFNELLQGITFGSGLTTFDLQFTNSFQTGTAPDSFAFFLLDSTLTPIATSDPTGADSLFSIDLTDTPTPDVFTSASATATVTPLGTAVPEPESLALLASAVGLAVSSKIRRG